MGSRCGMDARRGGEGGSQNGSVFVELDLFDGYLNCVSLVFGIRFDGKQFFGLQLDRGNLSNALTDNLLADLHMTSDDYNNVQFSLSSGYPC